MKHTKESLMEQVHVFASAWSLIGGRFDRGNALDDAEQAKTALAEMVDETVRQRDELLQELRYIANAPTQEWDDPMEFEAWAKNRARHAIAKAEAA